MTSTDDLHCVECGYALRDLDEGGDCPECGAAIARSTLSRQGLTKRELVVIGCRLLAVWFGVDVITTTVWLINTTIENFSYPGTMPWMMMLTTASRVPIYTAIAVGLWWIAPWLAKRTALCEGLVFPGPAPNGRAVWDIATRLLGLYLAAHALPELAANFVVQNRWERLWIVASIQLVVGLSLLLRWSGIKRSILWLRSAGTKSANP